MQCINHPEVAASAYCQNCGKALCAQCTERTPIGQVFCAACRAAAPAQGYTAPGYTASGYTAPGYPAPAACPPVAGVPNPNLAAFLGLFPGVGAMYNGQFFKGMVHVVIFAVLVTLTDRYDIVGIFIAAWILYQSFEAFHTARARRDGLPLPDPFGLNELGSWLNFGTHSSVHPGSPSGSPSAASAPGYTQPWPPPAGASATAPPYTEPYTGAAQADPVGNPSGNPANPWASPYVDPGVGGFAPIPPPLPRRNLPGNLPTGAIVLIVLGVLFLLQSMGFVAGIMRFSWPLLLIGLGVWLIISRTGLGGPRA